LFDGLAMIQIIRLLQFVPAEFGGIVTESESQGFAFLRRLITDWEAGTNRFALEGEALFAAQERGIIVGVCGLNIDPYASDREIGRVRHLYVLASRRRQGIGRRLVTQVMVSATRSFRLLRLRTDSPTAAAFYEALGFEPCTDAACTHRLLLHSGDTLPKN
jgi:GNAT superfamily N-acetyltransferase